MTIDTAKANGVYLEAARKALDHLQAERQAQQDRLRLAAQAKQQIIILKDINHELSCKPNAEVLAFMLRCSR